MTRKASDLGIKMAETIFDKKVSDVDLSEDKTQIVTTFTDGSEARTPSGRKAS